MLPHSDDGRWSGALPAMRFGNLAMERLVNEILKRGGQRRRLEVKIFGGASIGTDPFGIGNRNADYAERYFAHEGMRVWRATSGDARRAGCCIAPHAGEPSSGTDDNATRGHRQRSGLRHAPAEAGSSWLGRALSSEPWEPRHAHPVLIVDDSALIRQILTDILSAAPDITVVGTAPDPIVAREKIRTLNPDVLTLDIEMPRMDGLTFLSRLMALKPMPVLVISTLTQKGADTAIRAMELGAVDYVPKPLLGIADGMAALAAEIVAKVRAAALAKPRIRSGATTAPVKLVADPTLSTAGRVVAIGASPAASRPCRGC